MKTESNVMIIGPLSGYPEIDIENMNRHYAHMLTGSGVNILSLWEHFQKMKDAISKLPPHANNQLSDAGWYNYAKISFLNQALTCTSAVFLIPDMELCLTSKTLLALAYSMGHELLEIEDGELIYSPLSEGEVNYQFANPESRMNDDETNKSIGQKCGQEDCNEDEDDFYKGDRNLGALVDEHNNPTESQDSINRIVSPGEEHLKHTGGWMEKHWPKPL